MRSGARLVVMKLAAIEICAADDAQPGRELPRPSPGFIGKMSFKKIDDTGEPNSPVCLPFAKTKCCN